MCFLLMLSPTPRWASAKQTVWFHLLCTFSTIDSGVLGARAPLGIWGFRKEDRSERHINNLWLCHIVQTLEISHEVLLLVLLLVVWRIFFDRHLIYVPYLLSFWVWYSQSLVSCCVPGLLSLVLIVISICPVIIPFPAALAYLRYFGEHIILHSCTARWEDHTS